MADIGMIGKMRVQLDELEKSYKANLEASSDIRGGGIIGFDEAQFMNEKVEVVDMVKRKNPKKKMENPLEKRTKMPTFAEKYEEKLKEELFEEELKKLSEGIIDDGKPESEYYTENRLAEHHKRDGD